MPDNFYLGNLMRDLLPFMKDKLQLSYGIWAATALLTFSTLFIFMARYAERWDAVRRRERDMHNDVSTAIHYLDKVLSGAGCYRLEGLRRLLGDCMVSLLYCVAQIEMPSTLGSEGEAEAIVYKEWRSLPTRLAFCFRTLKRDDGLSLAVFLVQLSRILYSLLNALMIRGVRDQAQAIQAGALIAGEGGMLERLVGVAAENGNEAQLVKEGQAFVPWLHITSKLSPGAALKKGLPVKNVHSIYLKMPGARGAEYRAKVDVTVQENAS